MNKNDLATRIVDVDGDELVVVEWDDPRHPTCVAAMRVESWSPTIRGVGLDLAGIAALRIALDKAEAARLERLEWLTDADGNVVATIEGYVLKAVKNGVTGEVREAQVEYSGDMWTSYGLYRGIDIAKAEAISMLRCLLHGKEPQAKKTSGTTLGQRIRAARRAAGKNLEDTANAMGTRISYASDIERGNVQPTDDQLVKLAALFGIDVKKLKG
jgi:hypothetical protein